YNGEPAKRVLASDNKSIGKRRDGGHDQVFNSRYCSRHRSRHRARCPRNGNRGYGERVTSHRQGRSARQSVERTLVWALALLSSRLPERSEKIRTRTEGPSHVANQSATPAISDTVIQITLSI